MVLKGFILTKVPDLQPAVLLKTTSSTSNIQGFCLIFRKPFSSKSFKWLLPQYFILSILSFEQCEMADSNNIKDMI